MDKMTPMDPEYQETPPEWQPGTPGYYGTGRLPKPPRSHTGLIVVLLCVMIVANVITVLMLLTLRMRAVQKNTTVGAETETGVTPTLTAPSGHSVEPTEPRTNGTGTLQISAEDTQTRSAGEIYTAMRPSLALVYADGNGGTAIVMTADGYLITNAHTVSGAESITVQLSDGTEYAAALSGMDESSDLAVLKIEPETALQPAEFGDSAGAAAGDTVYVFSHPFGAAFDNATMTDGSIATVQSGVRIGAETLNVFQTDAAPDSGSAGGPLVNEAGQVMTVRGESLGGGKVRIVEINHVKVDFTGEYSAIIVIHQDTPGVVAYITRCLSERNINIAFMRLFRESKGTTAYTIVESDGHLPEDIVESIHRNTNIHDVMVVQM